MSETFLSFEQSLARLDEILKEPKTIANRDSSIKRFELTAELLWKSIQKFLREKKIICRSPKDCLDEAFSIGLLSDEVGWLKIIDDRNESMHTYSEEFAEALYERLPSYLELLRGLQKSLRMSDA